MRTAQAFGSQGTFSGIYAQHTNQALTIDLTAAVWQGAVSGALSFVTFGSYALAFSFGTTLINSGHGRLGNSLSSVHSLRLFFQQLVRVPSSMYFSLLSPDLSRSSSLAHKCRVSSSCLSGYKIAVSYSSCILVAILIGRGAASKIFSTIDLVPHIDSSSLGGLKPDSIEGRIVLENVEFNYPSRPNVPVVKSITLHFAPGKTSALVGASGKHCSTHTSVSFSTALPGSGKSTAISLIERFYDPLSGTVKLDGRDVKDLNLRWLRSQIGLVSQEPTLFATTVKENISHGLINTRYEHASEADKLVVIKEACIKANAHGFISELPAGYDTMVGERGFLLSGGQKRQYYRLLLMLPWLISG